MRTASTAIPTAVDLYGVEPQAVINAIKERAALGRAGAAYDDGRKIGLVIEGGGMRGVLSAGGAVALGHLGLDDAFDEVYATSAGAMNAAYLLSSQRELGISIYYEDLAGRRFINPLRLWKMLDIDYLFSEVVAHTKPLDVEKLQASRPGFFVAMMNRATGKGIVVDVKQSKTPVLDILKAATAIPVFYNRTIPVDGVACMDGGLPIPFPIEYALGRGCTHLLVLLTRPAKFICAAPGRGSRLMFNAICARGNRSLTSAYFEHHDRERITRALALGRSATPAGVKIATICSQSPDTIHRTTVDGELLRQGAIAYGRQTLRVFGADADEWTLAPIQAVAGRK